MRSPQPEAAKLKVFVSYSRSDIGFADQLVAALAAYGIAPSLDREGIHGAEKWRERLGQLILEADTVVFILTPDSAASDVCKWEVDQAVKLNKRIVPIVWRPLGEAKPHDHLRGLNYIYFYDEPSATGSGFGTGLARLVDALTTDVDWIREHTRLGELAARWDRAGRPADALLRGMELTRAGDWRKERPSNAPELSSLQRDFLQASEEAEAQRTDAARRQLEEMRAAQEAREKALKEAEAAQRQREEALAHVDAEQKARAKAQRRGRYLAGAAALLALVLFGGALWQSRDTQRREALVMTSAAERAIQQGFYDRAIRIAVQGLPKASALPLFALGWDEPEIRGLEAKLAGAAQASAQRAVLQGHDNWVSSAAFSPDGARIVTASWDTTARVWDAKSGQALLTLNGHDDVVLSAAFSPDGTRIVTASEDKTARIWDAKSGQALLTLKGHDDAVMSAAFSPDGARIVTASRDKTARIWDAKSGQALLTLQGHDGWVSSAAFSPDGARIVTASEDKTARLWDAKNGQALLT
ncbi:MAG: TIR domain-containing protein, partial [Rhodomicrobium sp.]